MMSKGIYHIALSLHGAQRGRVKILYQHKAQQIHDSEYAQWTFNEFWPNEAQRYIGDYSNAWPLWWYGDHKYRMKNTLSDDK